MEILRTPDDRFTGLAGFDLPPRYIEVAAGDGTDATLRLAYVEAGDPAGPVVLLLHGEPSWSYLYRTMIPVLADAGLRVIAPDLVGFGRSDKPAAMEDHTYERHVEWLRAALFDALDLEAVTLFCQDWGGLLGLRLVGEHPDRFARICAANTGLPDGTRRLPEAWWRFHDFVQNTPDLPVGFLVASGVANGMAPDVQAAYDAPFPDAAYKAGPRAMPGLIPQTLDDPATPANQAAWEVLRRFDRPVLCLFSDSDPITKGGERALIERIPGAAGQPHASVPGGHFLQEDSGPQIAARVVDWIGSTP
ncbi:MAG: haloalkane dehalogenase [Actinobacteria bacterium]|nr:haloalkane dehalogenase [Actinomycetota bacterium]